MGKLVDRYIGKIPFLAFCMLGGETAEDMLKMKDVTEVDLEDTRKFLSERGFSIGKCERCDKITWLQHVKLEKKNKYFKANLCMRCVKNAFHK